jgi:hypothetical protein
MIDKLGSGSEHKGLEDCRFDSGSVSDLDRCEE